MEPIKHSLGLLVGIVLLLASGSCTTVPVTGRSQFTGLVSPSQEMQLGLTAFDQMKKETAVSRDPALNALVNKVGRRIAAVAELPNAQWEFVVFESPEVNAFCLPGGKVGIYKGILPVTKDEAGMATVIGHEVAHAVARHGAERMSQATALQSGGEILGAALTKATPQTQALASSVYGMGSQLGVLLPYSRKHEAEADQIGLIYMARAGYRPEAAVDFWRRFAEYNQKHGGASQPWFLRTHPLDEDRIRSLQDWLPRAQAEYRPAS